MPSISSHVSNDGSARTCSTFLTNNSKLSKSFLAFVCASSKLIKIKSQEGIGLKRVITNTESNKLRNANINDANFIYYAPCISSDNLELYYTRYL